MKKTTALYAVAAIAALSFASHAFARGGSMGGGQSHGGTSGTHQTTTSMQQNLAAMPAGTGMQQGSGSATMQQKGSGNGAGMQQQALHGQMNGTASAPAAQRMTASTSK